VIPPMLRIGGKTLTPLQTIDDLVAGRIKPPANAGRINPPQHHEGAPRGGRPRKHPPKPQTHRPKAAAAE
jgi:hypothetical protein